MLNPNLYGSPKQKKAYETVALENRELISELSLTDRFILERRYTDIGGSYLDDFQYTTPLNSIVRLIEENGDFVNGVLTGYQIGLPDPLLPTDTIIEAFGKLEAQILEATPKLQNELVVTGVGTVGAVSDGKTWAAGTLIETVLNEILRQRVAPTYVAPAISLTLSGSTTVEVGSSISVPLTTTFTQNDAGALTLLEILRSGVLASSPTSPLSFTENTTAILGNLSYTAQATYAQGPVKNDSFGDPNPAGQIPAGTIVSVARTVTGIYPWFFGKVSSGGAVSGANRPVAGQALLNAIASNKQVSGSTGTISMNFNSTSDDYLVVAIPTSSTLKTKWYVTALNNGNIGGAVSAGGNLFPDPTTITVDSPTGLWTGVSYRFYISNYQTAQAANMELRNS